MDLNIGRMSANNAGMEMPSQLERHKSTTARLLSQEIAKVDFTLLNKTVAGIESEVLRFALKKTIIEARNSVGSYDARDLAFQELGQAESTWKIMKTNSTAFLYGYAAQKAQNSGIEFANPDAVVEDITEFGGLECGIFAMRGRLELLSNNSKEAKKLFVDLHRALWLHTHSVANAEDYTAAAIFSNGLVDVDKVVSEVSSKGACYQAGALKAVYSHVKHEGKEAMARAKFYWRRAELEACDNPSSFPEMISEYLKSVDECVESGAEGISREDAMALVLLKDPEYFNRIKEKALSDAKRTVGHLGSLLNNLDEGSAKAIIQELEKSLPKGKQPDLNPSGTEGVE